MIRRAVATALAAGVGALCLLLPAAPASAHASLKSSDPAAGAVLPSAPDEVTLTFSEPVNVALGRVVVLDPDAKAVQKGKASRRGDGSVVVVKLRDDLRNGTFLVSFRVVSADGHPISGSITFSIGAPSQQSANPEGTGEAQVDPVVRGLLAAGKYAGYAGSVLLVGPVLMLLQLWPRRVATAGPVRLAWIGWGLLFGGTAVSILAQAPYGTGGTFADTSLDQFVDTAAGGVGAAQVIRLALLLAGIPLIRRVTTGAELGRPDQFVLAICLGVGLMTWPLAGHAAASPTRLISIPSDAIHVGAMAVWLGGLVVLAGYLLPAARSSELGLILPVWSRWAMYAVVAIAFTGTVQALVEVGSVDALLGSTYGRLVIAKIAGFVAILAVAYFSRRWVLRHFAAAENVEPTDGQRRAFRVQVAVEVGLAAVVVAFATLLVQTSPGRVAPSPATGNPAAAGQVASTTVKTSKMTLQFDVDPGRQGNNSIHLYAFTPDGKPLTVVEWKASAALPAKGVADVDIPVLPITANHAVGEIQLPAKGKWSFKFTVRTSDIDQETVSREVTIR